MRSWLLKAWISSVKHNKSDMYRKYDPMNRDHVQRVMARARRFEMIKGVASSILDKYGLQDCYKLMPKVPFPTGDGGYYLWCVFRVFNAPGSIIITEPHSRNQPLQPCSNHITEHQPPQPHGTIKTPFSAYLSYNDANIHQVFSRALVQYVQHIFPGVNGNNWWHNMGSEDYWHNNNDNVATGDSSSKTGAEGYSHKMVAEGYMPKAATEGYSSKNVAEGYIPKAAAEGYMPKAVAEGYIPKAVAEDYSPKAVAEDYRYNLAMEQYKQLLHSRLAVPPEPDLVDQGFVDRIVSHLCVQNAMRGAMDGHQLLKQSLLQKINASSAWHSML